MQAESVRNLGDRQFLHVVFADEAVDPFGKRTVPLRGLSEKRIAVRRNDQLFEADKVFDGGRLIQAAGKLLEKRFRFLGIESAAD